jgi:hypothetical protein
MSVCEVYVYFGIRGEHKVFNETKEEEEEERKNAAEV